MGIHPIEPMPFDGEVADNHIADPIKEDPRFAPRDGIGFIRGEFVRAGKRIDRALPEGPLARFEIQSGIPFLLDFGQLVAVTE